MPKQIADEARLAPRSSILRGTALLPSLGEQYMITVPQPQGEARFGPITAESRTMALYAWCSAGGFSLAPSQSGLTVWTIEEWEEAEYREEAEYVMRQFREGASFPIVRPPDSEEECIVNEQQIIHPTATTFKPWSRTVVDVYEVGLVGDKTFSILRLKARPTQSTSAITCFVNGLALCPGIDFDLGDTVVIEGSVVYTIALKNVALVAGDRAWVTYGCYGG